MSTEMISAWLHELDSHAIYDAQALEDDFRARTGGTPAWATWPAADTLEAVGTFKGPRVHTATDRARLEAAPLHTAGWVVAEGLAHYYANFASGARGRGTIYRECVAALEQAGR